MPKAQAQAEAIANFYLEREPDMEATKSNTEIWDYAKVTNPRFTKSYKGTGGFQGTAVDPIYNMRRATEVFGPYGKGWGVRIDKEEYVSGGEGHIVHVLQISLWYRPKHIAGGSDHEYSALGIGTTTFAGKNKHGRFVDAEAPKKSLTDAISNALVKLGFSADVYLGMFDDSKYVAWAKEHAK